MKTFEIDEYIVDIDNMFQVKVSIHSKRNSQVIFEIKTKFWARSISDQCCRFYLKKFPKEYQLNKFEVKKEDGIILIHNVETNMRICRIPVSFIEEVIDKCDKLVAACSIEPRTGVDISHEDIKVISVNCNSDISFSSKCDSNLLPGYLHFSEMGRDLANWMTLLEYQNIPDCNILVNKRINDFKTIEV